MAKEKKRVMAPKGALSKDLVEVLKWVRFINEFRSIERTIWYKESAEKERDGEHCYQLLMVGWHIRNRWAPHLDLLKICKYVSVHDTPEKIAKDTPAFKGNFGEFESLPSHADKAEREKRAIEQFEREWGGHFPDFVDSILAYEGQADEESRFVYALDKFLAEVNIYLDKGYTDRRLGVTLDEKQVYKRPKIAKHPLILKFHDELFAFIKEYRRDAQFQTGDKQARPKEAIVLK